MNTGRTSLLCFFLFFVALFAAIPLIEVNPAAALAAAAVSALSFTYTMYLWVWGHAQRRPRLLRRGESGTAEVVESKETSWSMASGEYYGIGAPSVWKYNLHLRAPARRHHGPGEGESLESQAGHGRRAGARVRRADTEERTARAGDPRSSRRAGRLMIGLSRDRRSLLALLVVFASLLGCSSAQAAIVTVGSPLTASFLPATVGENGILGINSQLGEPGAHVSSPVDGAVIGWKVLGQGGPFELRVVRPEAAGTFLAGAAGAPQTLGSYGVGSFAADLPIEAGELVGIQVAEGAKIGNAMGDAPGSTAAVWVGSPESEAVAPEREAADWELSFSATVLPAPTITSVAPSWGPITGGTSVTVTGTDFTDIQSVSFGPVPAAGYSVSSEGQLTAVAPAGTSAGAVPISVTTEAGTAISPQPFTYSAPAPAASTGPAPTPPVPECVVPMLHGKRLKAVRKTVAKADCKLGKVTRKGTGTARKRAKVVKQRPKAGTIRAPRSKVDVVLAGR